MISVIVPVYNVEPYLRQCLDSILAQTCQNVEILLIDDGSTDGGGRICDEYGETDIRISVFHTENRGLSAARNLGLKHARGSYIGFVDPDDWVEPCMYEILLQKANRTGADVVSCAVRVIEKDQIRTSQAENAMFGEGEAIKALLRGTISNAVWNKLWKAELFAGIEFPEGRNFEDIALVYRLLERAKLTVTLREPLYTYRRREGRITKDHQISNLIDYYDAHLERYAYIQKAGLEAELLEKEQKQCALAVLRIWVWYEMDKKVNRLHYRYRLPEMSAFMKAEIPPFGRRGWSPALRAGLLFTRSTCNVSLYVACLLGQTYRRLSILRKRILQTNAYTI